MCLYVYVYIDVDLKIPVSSLIPLYFFITEAGSFAELEGSLVS